jgi:hypothetical protein
MTIQILTDDLYAIGFSDIQIDLGNEIFQAVAKLKHDQPLEEGVIHGTSVMPLKRTVGQVGLGQGEIQFADIEDAQRLVEGIGDNYYLKVWPATFFYHRPGRRSITHKLFECRILNVQDDHSQGTDALGETIPFSFMRHSRNGLWCVIPT